MHSTQFTRLAQAADGFGYVIYAMLSLAPSEGTFPAATCILHDPDRPADRAFATSLGVLPDDGEAFFTGTRYDLSLIRALEVHASKTGNEYTIAVDNFHALKEVI